MRDELQLDATQALLKNKTPFVLRYRRIGLRYRSLLNNAAALPSIPQDDRGLRANGSCFFANA